MTTEVQVVDEEAGIWFVPIPVRCETSGWLVLWNEEAIGSVSQTQDGYEAVCPKAPRDSAWLAKRYDRIDQAARAVAVAHAGDLFPGWMPTFDADVEGEFEDEDSYDAGLHLYVVSGLYPRASITSL